jgi:hypothetical protein
MRALALVVLAALTAMATSSPGSAQTVDPVEDDPKLGIDATPITAEFEYLQLNPAPDYWAFAPFVRPQQTSSACAVAAVTGAINGLAGLPASADEPITSQTAMLDRVGDDAWRALSAEGGEGATFDQLAAFTAEAVEASGLIGREVRSWRPPDNGLEATSTLREWLTANEASAEDAMLVYFNQGVLTGDRDGPHVAVIGAYDPAAGRVLILEVDQEWYVPYWSSDVRLLEAMLKPASAEHGSLEGETGGLVHIQAPPPVE